MKRQTLLAVLLPLACVLPLASCWKPDPDAAYFLEEDAAALGLHRYAAHLGFDDFDVKVIRRTDHSTKYTVTYCRTIDDGYNSFLVYADGTVEHDEIP